MANVRVCLCLLVLFVSYKVSDAEPTFGSAWCSFFNCDTDDDGTDDDDDDDDYYDMFDFLGICDGCSQTASSVKPSSQSDQQKPVNIVLPPSNGLNLSVSSGSNGAVVMNLMPWAAAPAQPAAAAKPEATTAAATTAGTTAATTAKATTKKA